MTGDLLCRIVNQAIDYRELMLTLEEGAEYWQWTQAHPHASICHEGQIVEIAALPLRILEV
jgi:hypothetical protein